MTNAKFNYIIKTGKYCGVIFFDDWIHTHEMVFLLITNIFLNNGIISHEGLYSCNFDHISIYLHEAVHDNL